LLLDVWPLHRLSVGNGVARPSAPLRDLRTVWPLIKEKLPLLALSAASSIVTFVVQQQGGAVSQFEAVPLSLRLQNMIVSYALYIGKMLWPARLALLYPYLRSLPASHVFAAA